MRSMVLDAKNTGAGSHMALNRSLKIMFATAAFAATSALPALAAPESLPPGVEATAPESDRSVVSTAAAPVAAPSAPTAARAARAAPKAERRTAAERRPAPRPVQRIAYNDSVYAPPPAATNCNQSIVCGGATKLLLVGIGF